MMRNGALGYLLKNVDQQNLVQAIETVVQDKQYIDFSDSKEYVK